MSILPTFANMVDYSSMKHSIVPRMTALCIQAGTTSVSYVCVCVEYALNRLLRIQIDQLEGFSGHLNRKCKLFKLLGNIMIHFPGIQTILMSSLKFVLQIHSNEY